MTRDSVVGIVAATARLRHALTQVSEALAAPQLDALLAGESAIERALAELPTVAAIDAGERAMLAREIEEARRALIRCRRLGAALTDIVRIGFEAQGRGPAYGPHGVAPAAPAFDRRSVSTRA